MKHTLEIDASEIGFSAAPAPRDGHGDGSMSICSWIRFHGHTLMGPTPWEYAYGIGSKSK